MARIKRLWLLAVTATRSYAGTHAPLRLEIASHNGEKVWDDLGDPRQNDRERGQTGCQELVLSEADNLDDTRIKEIRLRIHDAHDAWMPKSIWVLSENVAGEIKVLSANPDWNSWFDPESRPGYALHLSPQ
jgi:hypothetical protein